MPLSDELNEKVGELARQHWNVRDGRVVPDTDGLTFSNTGVRINGAVLYADIHKSTSMVDALAPSRAAEYYKAYLYCAARIIKSFGGVITAYDGDRVMGVFVGLTRVDAAVMAAFVIHGAVRDIINPSFRHFYGLTHRELQHTVGIDEGELLATKAGVRDDSDLVWVGPAANYAAKLNSFEGLEISYPTRVSCVAYAQLSNTLKGTAFAPYWDPMAYTDVSPTRLHYRSNIAWVVP